MNTLKTIKPVIVLGMHRSGTSAIAEILSELGVHIDAAKDLILPNRGNLRGHFEPRDVTGCNDKILRNIGHSWIGPPTQKPYEWEIPSKLQVEMDKCIRKRSKKWDSWVWKDPRLCITLPVWKSRLGSPICIIIWRHPIEVALSLYKRDKIPIGASLMIWETYCRACIENTQEYPRLLCYYDDLLDDPKGNVKTIYKFLVENGLKGLLKNEEEIKIPVDSRLRHNVIKDEEENDLAPSQKKMVHSLKSGHFPILDFEMDSVKPGVVSELLTLSFCRQGTPLSRFAWFLIGAVTDFTNRVRYLITRNRNE